MDPILRIIHYLFSKKNIENTDNTFSSFFNNGIAFPTFVAIAFDIDEIPHIVKNPSKSIDKNMNNQIALQYLFDHNKLIAEKSPNYSTEQDKAILLSLILTRQCYQIDLLSMIKKCNNIVEPLGISFETSSDLLKPKCILALLNIFTDGKVSIEDDTTDFDSLMKNSFEIAKAPLVINKTSTETQNRFIYYIQIEILFDFFSNKTNPILDNSSFSERIDHSKTIKIVFSDFESSSEDKDDDDITLPNENLNKNCTLKYKNRLQTRFTESDFKDSSNDKQSDFDDCSSDPFGTQSDPIDAHSDPGNEIHDSVEEEERKEEIEKNDSIEKKEAKKLFGSLKQRGNDPCGLETRYNRKLLDVINAINNKTYQTFKETIENDVIPKFVMHVLNRNSIKNVNIEHNKKANENEFLSEIELNNINSVIRYLKKVEFGFRVLLFDFKNPKFIESSTVLFYRSFIHYFFLKNSREELFERCVTLIYDKITNKNLNHKTVLTDWNTYTNLIHFIEEKSLNTRNIRAYGYDVQEHFRKQKIPFIIDKEFLKLCSTQEQLPIAIYCQLKFIFNKIDEVGKSYHIVELFKSKSRKIEQMHVPKSEQLASNIRAKNISLILQKKGFIRYSIQRDINIDSVTDFKIKKYFIYNEEKHKWEYDINTFHDFSSNKKIAVNEMKTPLVLFLNSFNENVKDIIINAGFTITEISKIEDNKDVQIFVYGLNDRTFIKHILSNADKNEMIRPIFLFLHVPKNKENMENISTIVFQIYSFLCFISDIEIVVLNNKYYIDQIETVKILNNIAHSYKQEKNVEIDAEYNVLLESNYSDDEIEIIEDESSDEKDDDEEEEYIENEEIPEIYNFTKIGNNIYTKRRKIMFLVNDINDSYNKSIEKNFNKSNFFSSLKSNVNSSFISIMNYIITKNSNSYKSFIDNLTDLVYYDDNSKLDDVSRNFRFIQLSEISSSYIKLKNDENWEQNLSDLINSRFTMLINGIIYSQYLTILAKIRKEIINNFPPFDLEFKNKIYSVLAEIKTKKSQDNRKNLITEIENSSKLNLDYLKEVIQNELYWKDEDKENIIYNHIQFLKNEFFNIIALLYDTKLFKLIYEENKDILYDQINKDISIIKNEYFLPFTNLYKQSKQTKEKRDIKYQKRRGTNYAIRESENTREIKVTVQINDDLTSKIKQDF